LAHETCMAVEKIIVWNRVSSCNEAEEMCHFGQAQNDELTIVTVSASVQLDLLMYPSHAVFIHRGIILRRFLSASSKEGS
jgi:hypothetical protein